MATGYEAIVDAFDTFGQADLLVTKNEFYRGSQIFDYLFKKSGLKERQNSTDWNDMRGKIPNLQPFEGVDVEQTVYVGRVLDKTRVDRGFSAQDREKIEYDEGGKTPQKLKFEGAKFGIGMTLTDNELIFWDNLRMRSAELALEQEFENKWKGMSQDFLYSIAAGVYTGRGVVTPLQTGFTPYNSRITSVFGVTAGTKNELEGMQYHLFDDGYNYGGLNVTTYPFFKPNVFDLRASSSNDLGYDTDTNLNTRAKLVSTTNSLTTNKPIILDIIQRAIRKATYKGEKPDLGIMRKDLFDVLVDAIDNDKIGAGGNTAAMKEELYKMGFNNNVIIDGVVFIPEEAGWEDGTSATSEYIFPADTIYLLNTKYLHLRPNKRNNFVTSGWHKVQGVWFTQANELSVHLINYCTSRKHQSIIKFPAITY